jgi:hypothetical protein
MSNINNLIMAGGVATAIAAISYLLNKLFKFVQTATRFMDDWYGTDEYPGVVERLAHGNARFDYIEKEIGTIKAELFTNGGSSVRDAINRIEEAVTKKDKK